MTTIAFHETDSHAFYEPLLPDESLSSWVARHPSIEVSVDAGPGQHADWDFGSLLCDIPRAPAALRAALAKAASPPDDWILPVEHRWQYCPRCLTEDWAKGTPRYFRRSWLVAWRTCCPRHGVFISRQFDELPWPAVLNPVYGREVTLHTAAGFQGGTSYWIGQDRRGVHLEAAMSSSKASWRPKNLRRSGLRKLYREVISELVQHFSSVTKADLDASSRFELSKLYERQFINGLAEAIISIHSKTPLSSPVNVFRTQALVRAIGWTGNAPRRHPNDLLFESVDCVRPPSPTIFRAALPELRRQFCKVPLGEVSLLSIDEARVLGKGARALDNLESITACGRLGRLDRARGRLSPQPKSGSLSRIEQEFLRRLPISLPIWAAVEIKSNTTPELPRSWELLGSDSH